MKKLLIPVLCLFLLSACGTKPETTPEGGTLIESLEADDYAVLIPFQASPVRQYHGTYLGRPDFMEVGARMLAKSKAYFSVKDYFIGEGQQLTATRLGQLVKRESADNPYGLNPPSGSSFKTGEGETAVNDAVVVADVVETDFYKGSASAPVLSGMSLVVVLNQNLTQPDGTPVRITDQRLYEYGADMGRKLERYIRTLTDLEDIPVYITLFSTESADASLPGHFIGEGYFDGRSGQFAPVTETWVLFPSAVGTTTDPVFDSAFMIFRDKLLNFVPDSLGIIAEGRYVDGSCDYLRITVTLQAKTYTEIHALTQYVGELIQEMGTGDYDMMVRINSISESLSFIRLDRKGNLSVIETY